MTKKQRERGAVRTRGRPARARPPPPSAKHRAKGSAGRPPPAVAGRCSGQVCCRLACVAGDLWPLLPRLCKPPSSCELNSRDEFSPKRRKRGYEHFDLSIDHSICRVLVRNDYWSCRVTWILNYFNLPTASRPSRVNNAFALNNIRAPSCPRVACAAVSLVASDPKAIQSPFFLIFLHPITVQRLLFVSSLSLLVTLSQSHNLH